MKKRNQLVEEDPVTVKFLCSLAIIITLFETELLKSATLKYALCLFRYQVEADGGVAGVDVFESQSCVFKMSLEHSLWTEKFN